MSTLRITTFKDSHEPFKEALEDAGIKYSEPKLFSENVMASGMAIMVSLSVIGALAAVLRTWIKTHYGGKVVITGKDGEAIHIEGMSEKAIARTLKEARGVTVIDTKPKNGT